MRKKKMRICALLVGILAAVIAVDRVKRTPHDAGAGVQHISDTPAATRQLVSSNGCPPGQHTLNLGEPGVLEALREHRPQDYAIVRRILDEVPGQPDAEMRRWMQVTFQASHVSLFRDLLYTSNPPRRNLAFKLNDTCYAALVPVAHQPFHLR